MEASTLTQPAVVSDPNDDFKPLDSIEARKRRYRAQLTERQKDTDQKLWALLLALRTELRGLDAEAREKHLQDIDMMCRYVNGDQYGEYAGGVYHPPTLNDGDYAYTIPVITGHVEQAFMQLLKTKVEYEFEAKDAGDPGAKEVTRMCEELAVEEKSRLMTEDARMDEIWNSILAGESQRLLLWGVNPEAPKMTTRVDYQKQEVETAGRRECQACGYDVPVGVAACPHCQSTYIKDIPGARFTKSIAQPPVQVALGENLLHIPHPTSVQRDLSAQKLRYSTFIIERDYLPKNVAEWRYQTIIDPSAEQLPYDIRLRQEQERSSMQTDPIAGSSRQGTIGNNLQSQPVVREYIYLDVARYGSIYNAHEETTPDGDKIPVGFLGDSYPDGLFLLIIGNTIIKMKGVNLNRRWTEVLYGKRAGSARGAGLQALMPLNDIVNDSFNLEYSLGMSGHPFTAVVRKHVKELPEANHLLFVDNPPPGGIDSIIKRFQGQSSTGFLGATAEKIEAAMQFIGGTPSLTGNYGAPDAKVMSTATGVAATTENAAGRMTGPIHQSIFADKEMMFQILENIKEFSSPEQKKELEKRFGPDTCKRFFQCNFRQTINMNVAANTDAPRSMALTQAKAMAFGQIAQAFAKTQVPWAQELLSSLADTMGVPFDIGPGRTDRREAEYRLNKLAAIEEKIAAKNPAYLAKSGESAATMFAALTQFCDPLMEPDDPAACFLQDHNSFMDIYKDSLFSEQAKTWSEARRQVVVQLWMLHFDAQQARQFQMATLQKKLGERLAPQPSPEELAAQQDAEDQRMIAAETLTRQADEAAKDAQLDRDMEKAEHASELQVATEQARQAVAPSPNGGKGNGAGARG